MNISLHPATEADLSAVVVLMNAAFRGSDGESGWSVESAYITGSRTNESLLQKEIAGGALLLVTRDETTSAILGCVSLQQKPHGVWYLGSLTVNPTLQNGGLGRQLLAASEAYAAQQDARTIEMTVVNVRDTLIAWYQRRGYELTGETRPFPYDDNRFGIPTRDDLHFVVLEKHLPAWPPHALVALESDL